MFGGASFHRVAEFFQVLGRLLSRGPRIVTSFVERVSGFVHRILRLLPFALGAIEDLLMLFLKITQTLLQLFLLLTQSRKIISSGSLGLLLERFLLVQTFLDKILGRFRFVAELGHLIELL